MKQRLWFLALPVALNACASQGPTTAAAYSGGCQVDALKICQQVRDKPIELGPITGYVLGSTRPESPMLEQNVPVTMTVGVPIKGPDGSTIAEVSCFINTRHRSVVYARVTRTPQTEREIDYARNVGICSN